jgi:hypothetical protein
LFHFVFLPALTAGSLGGAAGLTSSLARDGSLWTFALAPLAVFFSGGFATGFTGSWMILADSCFLTFLTAFLGFFT